MNATMIENGRRLRRFGARDVELAHAHIYGEGNVERELAEVNDVQNCVFSFTNFDFYLIAFLDIEIFYGVYGKLY